MDQHAAGESPAKRKITPAYRAQLSCKVGKDVLRGKTGIVPQGVTPVEWALFNLLSAVEDVAEAIDMMGEAKGDE